MIRAVLLFLLFAATVSHADIVRIADGDCTGLHTALTSSSSRATVLLARGGHYPVCDVSLPSGVIDIDAQGATFQYLTGTVAAGAALTIRNASIVAAPSGTSISTLCDPSSIGVGGPITAGAALCNEGILNLEDISIHDLSMPEPCVGSSFACENDVLLSSEGTLVLRNVTVANSSFVGGHYTNASLIANTGSLQIFHFTAASLAAAVPVIFSGSSSSTTIANSVFSTTSTAAFCKLYGVVTSLGGNVATEASCGFAEGARDTVAADIKLGAFGDHGGLVPTQALTYYSPARAAGGAQNCEAVDARGYTRARSGCDAGAYEYNGGSSAITANGVNGTYYDAGADGHYVSIERVHDNGDILVTWLTFDRNGDQAWIAGVGSLDGRHLHVDMSQNIGGVLQPGGPPNGSTTRAWGSVDIDLTTCLAGQFAYHSNFPEFGSGQFPLSRLTAVSDLGCSD